MKIYLASDLHTELETEFPLPAEHPDLVVLAGDIARGTDAVGAAGWYRHELGVPVILIAGNHEFYRREINKTYQDLRKLGSELSQIHFLENDSVVVDGIRFLGCTLWTNFALYGLDMVDISKHWASIGVNDFRLIGCGDRMLTPEDLTERFNASYLWLESELSKPFDGKTVVVTHFAPHEAAIHPRYKTPTPDKLTPYFTPICTALIEKYSISAWMYGHTHNSVDVVVENGTRLISNQVGYPNEPYSYSQFDRNKIIEI